MTIPSETLRLKNTNDLTLDEACMFEGALNMTIFRAFLIEHAVNWTREEIGALRMSELQAVAEQVRDAIRGGAVPLGNRPRSKVGRKAKVT